jgi:hypothetical protein
MIVMFKKNIIISSCLFICVSCAIPPVQQPPLTPAPVTRDELKPSPSPNNQQQPPSKIQSPTLPVVPEKPPVQSQLPIKPAPSISPPSISNNQNLNNLNNRRWLKPTQLPLNPFNLLLPHS